MLQDLLPSWTPLVAEGSILPFRTAADDLDFLEADPVWVIKEFVPEGSITEIVGKIKLAGKTTFLMCMAKAIVTGQPFLELPTKQSPVIYLTESPRAAFREAIKRAGLVGERDFVYLFWHDAFGLDWQQVARQACHKAKELGAFLIVDTLPQFAGIRGESENSTGGALKAMEPLQLAASSDLGIAVVRHERKSGGDVGDSGRGSSAYGGAVDTLMTITRGQGITNLNIRVIKTVSRFDSIPSDLHIELTETGFIPLGTTSDVTQKAQKEAVLSALPDSKNDASTNAEIKEETALGKTTVADILKELAAEGIAQMTGSGKKGDPYKFWKPEMLPVALKDEGSGGMIIAEEEVEFVPATTPYIRAEERIRGAL